MKTVNFTLAQTLEPCMHVQACEQSREGSVVYTLRLFQWVSSTVNEIQLQRRETFKNSITKSAWVVKTQSRSGLSRSRSISFQCLTITFGYRTIVCIVPKNFRHTLRVVIVPFIQLSLCHQGERRTTNFARIPTSSLDQCGDLDGMSLKICVLVFWRP